MSTIEARQSPSENCSSNPKSYNFFTLPPELRLKVYGYLMNTKTSSSSTPILRIQRTGKIMRRASSSQFLRTCKTVYKEAHPILYNEMSYQAKGWLDLKLGIMSVGSLARTYIKRLLVVQQNYPTTRFSRFQTQIPGVGLDQLSTVQVEPRSLFQYELSLPTALPSLPALESITIRTRSKTWRSGIAPQEPYLEQLAASIPQRGHELYDIMTASAVRPEVAWYLSMRAEHISVNTLGSFLRSRLSVVKVRVSVEYLGEGQQRKRRWHLDRMP